MLPRALTAAAALALPLAAAHAAVIGDASYFNALPSTHLTFETNGAGAAVSLIQGQTALLPAAEYAAQGITFDRDIRWVNDGSALMDAAQTMGGTPTIAIPSSSINTFEIIFTQPVFAVGFFVANNRTVDPAGPIFTALNSTGGTIETAQFGGALVDNSFSGAGATVDYGFMGIASATPISRLRVQKTAAILDDLRFTTVPTPGAAAVLGLGALTTLRRRR